MDWHPIQGGEGGVEIFLVASCQGNRDKLRPDGPLGSYADFTYLNHNEICFKFVSNNAPSILCRRNLKTQLYSVLRLESTLIGNENGTFQKRSSKPEEFENASFALQFGQETF